MSQGYYVLSPSAAPRDAAPRNDVRRVVVQRDVTEIGDDAFRSWASLEEVVFEPGSRLERIGKHTFAGTALKNFTAPDSLRSIGDGAFAGCKNLKEVRLNQGLQYIGGDEVGAFQDSGLRTAYVPSLLGRLRSRTFAGCKNLRKITVAEGCDVRLEYCLDDGQGNSVSVTDGSVPCFVQSGPASGSTPGAFPDERDQQIRILQGQLQKVTQLNTQLEDQQNAYRQQCEQLRAEKQ